MAEHSGFGGSSAYRWLNCPGSVALLETIPAKPASAYAEEGTLAHGFAAWCLEQGERFTNDSIVGMTLDAQPGSKPCTEEMAAAIQVYLDAVYAELDKTPDAHFFVEKGFVLDVESAKQGEVFGTNDAMVYHPTLGRLVVFDYKHGQGVSVSAEDNDQLKFYAAGAAFSHDWPLKEVVLVIVQPRARDLDDAGPVRQWTFDPVDLLEFQQQCSTAIHVAKEAAKFPELPGWTQAGPWCDKTFCDARITCPAYQALKLSETGFEDVDITQPLDLPHPSTLSPERLAKIVAGVSALQSWFNVCQEYLEAQVLGGVDVPGWKVVEKIGRAKWISDEEEIAAELELEYGLDVDLIRPRKLETITNVEKLMKANGANKDAIDSFKIKNTIKESSGLTIAPETDRRPAVNLAERAFGEVSIEGPKGS